MKTNAVALSWIALGSNLANRLELLRAARAALYALLPTEDLRARAHSSSLYQSSAHDCPENSPDFFNAVISLPWPWEASHLLRCSQSIETALGRVRTKERNAARTIDIDILAIEGVRCKLPELELPHPRLFERRFVLEPLAELANDSTLFPLKPEQNLTHRVEELQQQGEQSLTRIGPW